MIKRLIDFYHGTPPEQHEATMTCIWEGITRVYQGGLIAALKSKDESRVLEELTNFTNTGAHGMNRGPGLYSLPNLGMDMTKLSDDELFVPRMDGSGPLSPSTRPDQDPSLYASVAALIVRENQGVPSSVLEIGAGLGFLGVIMFRWGVNFYADLDLPSNAVAAAFYLSRCCGEENIWMLGEEGWGKRLEFHPATNFTSVPNRKYDVILNLNSFPEIPIPAQDEYLALISDCLSPKGIFVSINHEATVLGQRSVSSATTGHKRLTRYSKNPSPILKSYFEEVYRLA